jgi:2-amino-4-hydroxy-6-hydroxymethyldihydropteridine diphosphokinase
VTHVVVALGSNLGDRPAALRAAVTALAAAPGVEVVAVSSVYETDPVGGPLQPDYLNACVLLSTSLSPEALLAATQAVETELGRVRLERWGPRTIDIDIVDYAGVVQDSAELTLPHPRALSRAFVVLPWLEVVPSAVASDGGVVSVDGLDVRGVRRRGDRPLPLPGVRS